MNTLFTEGWSFYKTKPGTTYDEAHENLDLFEEVLLPHDFAIEKFESFYEDATGWYRKVCNIAVPQSGKVILRFDGIYMDSVVYVNGKKACEWKYGYTWFNVDITPYIIEGENEICVSVTYMNPNSRWYSGAGITRNVYLEIVPEVYIPDYGMYVNAVRMEDAKARDKDLCVESSNPFAEVAAGSGDWLLTVDTYLAGDVDKLADDICKLIKLDITKDGEPVDGINLISASKQNCDNSPYDYEDANITLIRQQFSVSNPKLWDIDNPNVYTVTVSLINGETQSSDFGFRHIELTSDKGVFLNGHHIKLNGVCEHHDFGMIGGAFYADAMVGKLYRLKQMGVNSIRFSHNPVDPMCLALCDRMGFLIMSEAFDMWEKQKTTYDYARFFNDWQKRDVISWVLQDRNHPCIIMWSIGNEIYDIHLGERGREIVNMLSDEVRSLDPLHNGYITFCSNYMPWEGAQKAAEDIEVVGYNYAEKYYEEHHAKHPDWIIYGSETSSITYSRDTYHFPFDTSILAEDDSQCSDLGNSITSWGADSLEECACFDRDTEFSLGQYLWTGHDYLGEPTPYHTKNSYFGMIDTAGYPKAPFYGWKSTFTYKDGKSPAFVHITPDWDFNPGQMIDVRVYSNASEVELFISTKETDVKDKSLETKAVEAETSDAITLEDKIPEENTHTISLGRQKLTHEINRGYRIIADYRLAYTAGELKAVAYDECGEIVATDIKHSYKDTSSIKCVKRENPSYDDYNLKDLVASYKRHLVFYDITAVDADGHEVENASDLVTVCVTGGKLVVLDNGDSTDFTAQKSNTKRLFKGRLLAVVECDFDENVSINVSIAQDIIPVRKIELESLSANALDAANDTVKVKARILPANASDRNVTYKITDKFGNESTLAKIEEIRSSVTIDADSNNKSDDGMIKDCKESGKEDVITIRAIGDGSFYLKAFSNSSTENVRVISQLEFTASGLGEALLNPYGFIPGSCYSGYVGEVGVGNERGVSTARGAETAVVFEKIDFGPKGSNEITIPIFSLDSDPKNIDIYDGVYESGQEECILNGIYHLPSIWNVYQAQTYKLGKVLKGIHTISLRTQDKIHIKGFSFKEYNPVLDKMDMSVAEHIYGDTYTVREDYVEGIGNNVTIDFGQVDFTENEPHKITICGRAKGERNTIHLRFAGSDGEVRNILECDPTKEMIELEFEVSNIKGLGSMQLIFLPGCDYDFKWIKFE